MRPLYYFRWWLALGWGVVMAVVALSLVPEPPVAIPFRFGDKLGHFLAYSAMMAWFVQLYHSRRLLLLHALALVTLGVALEFLQGLSGRHFELADMAANTTGVLLGLSLLLTPWQHLLQQWERRLLVPFH